MSLTRDQVESLVMQMQADFLGSPLLTLTASEAQGKYQVSLEVSRAVLDALVESRVLARTPEGVYLRWFPGRYSRYSPSGHAA